MSKPITITKELAAEMMAEIKEQIEKNLTTEFLTQRMLDGEFKFSFKKEWEWDDDAKAYIDFTPSAYAKMLSLIHGFDTEVAWHGVAKRDPEKEDWFHITDILVYPQEITATDVDTDEKEYANWTMDLDDETFCNLRMQGHSHVEMGTTPSSTDLSHQEKLVKQVRNDQFYIFLIWNKKGAHTIKVYDLLTNTLFEDADCVVCVGGEELPDTNSDFMKEAKDKAKRKYSSYSTSTYTKYPNYNSSTKTYTSSAKSNTKTSETKGSKNSKGSKKTTQYLNPYGYPYDGYEDTTGMTEEEYEAYFFGNY